jgi:hypothetical protein
VLLGAADDACDEDAEGRGWARAGRSPARRRQPKAWYWGSGGREPFYFDSQAGEDTSPIPRVAKGDRLRRALARPLLAGQKPVEEQNPNLDADPDPYFQIGTSAGLDLFPG